MGDTNGIKVTDLLGLSQPLTKLIETVGCGIGKLGEPWQRERMAKARAKEIEIISGAISDNLNLPVEYDNGNISISTKDANDLVIRAQNRFLFQEMKKQQNIESVVSNAYSELEGVDSVSNTPVDEDWISEFFDCVANISTEKMQVLWGKLLAGEVKKPGSFSLRTLEILKRLSVKEANIFKEIAPFVLQCKGDAEGTYIDYFLLPDEENGILENYDIPAVKIMLLSEAGLVSENSQVNIVLSIETNQSEVIEGINKSIKITNIGNGAVELAHPVYLLTEAGKELWSIVLTKENQENANTYLLECLEELQKSELATMSIKGEGDNARQISFEIIENE